MQASSPESGRPAPPARPTPAPAAAALPPPPRLPRRQKTPTRRTTLSVEAIVDAAIGVLDESGVAGLSMRRVADRLGTGAASLYAYVSGRDELLELVFDELVGQVQLPEPDPKRWREQLTEMLYEFHGLLVSHRDAALAGLGRVPTTPHTLAVAETIVNVMRAGGLSDKVIALGLDQLLLYVTGAAFEQSLYEYGDMSREEVEQYFEEVNRFFSSLPPDRFPGLASIGDEMGAYDGDDRLRFGLDTLIAGLEAVSRRG